MADTGAPWKLRRCAFALCLAAGAALAPAACSQVSLSDAPLEILVKSATLELAWDPPATATRLGSDVVTGYKVYSRTYPGYSSWRFLAEVEASESPSVLVTSEELPYGSYAFAVSATYEDGRESGYHTSIESSADPPTGWFVTWIGSE